MTEIEEVANRLNDLSPIWPDVIELIKLDLASQLEGSKDKDGKPFPKLSSYTKSKSRRSDRPIDTLEHISWDNLVSGGRITMENDSLAMNIKVNFDLKKYGIGLSEDCKNKITKRIIEYLKGE